MKQWAIHNCETNEVDQVYASEEVDFRRFGGRWGNKNKCHHIQVADDALDSAPFDLEIQMVPIQVGTARVPDGEPQVARDNQGNALQDASGNDIVLQDYKEEPIIEMQKRAVRKA